MSSVLQSPTLPMLAVIEERLKAMEARIKKLEEENAEIRTDLLETKEFLALSLKRNTQLENAIFEHNDEGEIIKDLEETPVLKAVISTEKPIEEIKDIDPIVANTTLTKKASALTEYLEKKTKANWSGKIVLENQDIYTFFKEIIQEDLRWPERMKGYRGAKKSIIERAQELFPNKVEVVRNKSGNKITGLALKPSVKRTGTNAC